MYTPDLLNRYERRTVPGVAQVTAWVAAGASVPVNSQAAYRRGDRFWMEVSVANAETAGWQSLAVQTGSSSATGHEFVPGMPELYRYDADGNLTGDGRWNYAWDGGNRLIRMIPATGVGPQQRSEYEYDASGRRVRKTVWNNIAGTGPASLDAKFLRDGWNLIAEPNAQNGDPVLRSYVCGLDLLGSSQGAGGVGGLLKVTMEELNEQHKADPGLYSIALGSECHKKSWEWLTDYLDGGDEIYPTRLPGGPNFPVWPERWFETRRHGIESQPPFPYPVPRGPAPIN